MSRRFLVAALIAGIIVVAGGGALYRWLVPGLSSARSEPGPLETKVATWLLHRSVPDDAKARVNPLASDPAEILFADGKRSASTAAHVGAKPLLTLRKAEINLFRGAEMVCDHDVTVAALENRALALDAFAWLCLSL